MTKRKISGTKLRMILSSNSPINHTLLGQGMIMIIFALVLLSLNGCGTTGKTTEQSKDSFNLWAVTNYSESREGVTSSGHMTSLVGNFVTMPECEGALQKEKISNKNQFFTYECRKKQTGGLYFQDKRVIAPR
jgi:hypothetical protein